MLIDFDLYRGFHTIQKSTCCRRLPPDPVLHLQAVEEPEKEVSDAKRSKSGEEGNGIEKEKEEGNLKPTKENVKPEPPRDYIHVRVRRGHATDCHSLAERVLKVSSDSLLPANPEILDGVDDLMQLSYLNEPSVLYNLQYRYDRDMIYASIC
uniref:Putative P-loop containing nucleoside triphosphate hydrolase n=1 Tax=Helianthus annuus TaxID=4232 RepID=A0A251RMD0_HELAN